MSSEEPSRAALRRARRVCIKAGTSVVAQKNGSPSLTRMGAIVEQISELVNAGVEVIFVSSGAVGMGKRLLRKQTRMNMSIKDSFAAAAVEYGASSPGGGGDGGGGDVDLMDRSISRRGHKLARENSFGCLISDTERPRTLEEKKKHYDSACAAAGQYEMMNLYCSLFSQYDVAASQLLVTQMDFTDPARLKNLRYAIERLLDSGILPILNENDAVSGNTGYTADDVFSDNDSLAALCARSFSAEALLLLTDVEGVYDRPPSDPKANLLRLYRSETAEVEIGTKSAQGRGGMAAKIDAAVSAVRPGSKCSACVVASGANLDCIRGVFGTKPEVKSPGTLFCTPGSALERQAMLEVGPSNTDALDDARAKALAARTESRKLQAMPYSARQDILRAIAHSILSRQDEIMAANALDVAAAKTENISSQLQNRLKLTEEKLKVLATGIRHIADLPDPLGIVKAKRELAEGLVLSQITVPIGVLLVIFESRPDSMPQISALALSSGNGLLLKGGKEAVHSNAAIHRVIVDAIASSSGGAIRGDIIGLVTSRGQVADMLGLDDVVDLVIPRGSNALVAHIKDNTKIPVLGHADGVCHVYVDETATAEAARKLVVDAKTDYPSACNAMETLLLHEATVANGVASAVLMALRAVGVKCLGGPRAMKSGLCESPSLAMKHEYGDLACMVEIVSNVDDAIEWIHANGSGHTETIVCANDAAAGETFLSKVDSACVFKNASTRFADGFRFGLGAEVGISTGRIHARGPVGVEGLLTTKWQLRSSNDMVDVVGDFGGDAPQKRFTHKDL